ncbi:MAG: aminomethyl transferase family protein [Gammaproteobacteria bacterium]|jgi:aminomethyltransferase|nr:aminomethyl transferase family protein [Gammaproteobacteria bacterium]
MTITRNTILASRHKELGSELEEWNNMGMPWTYDQDVNLEHQAIRNKACLFDLSGLKKVRVSGPDALQVLDHVCTRDLTLIYPGKSVYALLLDENGGITDDCIMFHIMPNCWMMVHGGGTAMEQLGKSAENKAVQISFDDDLHNLSLQGPAAVEFLDQHTPYDMNSLKYFHHTQTTLFGHGCMISRTGYSGERGYEIFAKADDIVPLWDSIREQGKSVGIIPGSVTCIDMVRVEAGLFFYPYDMSENDTPWEVGLGFCVSKKKQGDYRGKSACMSAMGKETTTTVGVMIDGDTAAEFEADVTVDGNKIGHVTGACYSTVMEASICMARVDKKYAETGQKLAIKSGDEDLIGTVATMPLFDPDKMKRSAV